MEKTITLKIFKMMKSTFFIAFFSVMAFLGGVRVDAQTIRLNTADLKAIKAQMETSDKQEKEKRWANNGG